MSEPAVSEGASMDASGRVAPSPVLLPAERRAEAGDASAAEMDESDSLVRPKKALPQDALPPAPLLRSDTSTVPRLDTRQRSARAAGDAAAAESCVGVALLSKPVKLAFRGVAAAAAAAAGLLEAGASSSRHAVAEAPAGDAVVASSAAAEGDAAAGTSTVAAVPAEAAKAAAKATMEAPKVSRRLMERGARRIRGELLQNEEPVRCHLGRGGGRHTITGSCSWRMASAIRVIHALCLSESPCHPGVADTVWLDSDATGMICLRIWS